MKFRVKIASISVAAVLIAACHGEATLVPRTNIPIVSLILTRDSLRGVLPELHALLANTGTPTEVEYIDAEQFIMRRAADGAVFDWSTEPVPSGQYIPFGGNYVLAESTTTRGLGRRDLVPGESYTLDITLADRVIHGAVTIPARPQPRITERSDGRRVVVWPKIDAAGLYMLEIESDFARTQATTDTFYVLHDDLPVETLPAESHLTITAMDSNWVHYQSNPTAVSAGLEGAYGVFGASSTTTIIIPRKSEPVSSTRTSFPTLESNLTPPS